MSVQLLHNSYQNIKSDFKSLRRNLMAVMDAKKSGGQDQSATSDGTLQIAMNQFQSDLSSLLSADSKNQAQSPLAADSQNLLNNLNAALDAKKSGDKDQVAAAEDALKKAMQQFQIDIAGLQGNHGRHHHHHKMNAAYANIATLNSNTTAGSGGAQSQSNGSSVNVLA